MAPTNEEHLDEKSLAARCANQLSAEHAFVTGLLTSVKATREALLSRDLGALERVLQERQLQPSADHLLERKTLRQTIADSDDCEEADVTLASITRFAKPVANIDVESIYQEIVDMRQEIETTNQGNLVIASSLSQMIDGFMHRAFGSPTSTTYGRDGGMTKTGPVGLIERRA